MMPSVTLSTAERCSSNSALAVAYWESSGSRPLSCPARSVAASGPIALVSGIGACLRTAACLPLAAVLFLLGRLSQAAQPERELLEPCRSAGQGAGWDGIAGKGEHELGETGRSRYLLPDLGRDLLL